nr:hypothetical protein [uncultured Prevotella sp.]
MNKFMKRTTIGSVMRDICYGFAALLFAASCANDDVAQNEKQKKDNTPAGATVFTGTSQPETTTRTAILNHTKGTGASVNWSSTDKIWVKDDGGTWQQSGTVTFPFATNKAQGMFALSGTYTGSTHDILYTNKTVSGTQPQVEIKTTQTQSAPNNFDHAGESGDYGIATGNKMGSDYKFTLNHKAAYLCFIPRSSNPYVNRSKLFKVEIMSDDDIAGTYDIAPNGALTLASGGSKTITVTTGSGFDIDNSTDDMSKNATYAVVAPGTHTFRIRYWLRNTTDYPDGTIEGTVSKIITLNCTAGSIHDITANLNPRDYDGDHYYMWDAQQNYWAGHEWNKANPWQPTLTTQPANPNYPQSNTDPRYYNEAFTYGADNPATHTSCKDLPNVNEMTWYAAKGEPRWDADELWTTMGHLYKGGMWFKKKANISGFNPNTAEDGTDWRTNGNGRSWSVSQTLPDAADANNYFYLPALGWYNSGQLSSVGHIGYYWSSSAHPWISIYAYSLLFSSGYVLVDGSNRYYGFRSEALQ